jgi:acyl carrier protein
MAISEADLKQVMEDIFGVPADMIDESTSIDTLDVWDSFKHMNLVLALEERFDITFTEEETVQILSYSLIKAVLNEHGVTFGSGEHAD